jgi:hypothetical protein
MRNPRESNPRKREEMRTCTHFKREFQNIGPFAEEMSLYLTAVAVGPTNLSHRADPSLHYYVMTGFGLVIRPIEFLQSVTTNIYNSLTKLHTHNIIIFQHS